MLVEHGLTWSEMAVGKRYSTAARTISDTDIVNFVNNAGFNEPLFFDMEYVATETPYKKRISPGLLTLSIAEGLVIQSGLFHLTALALLSLDLSIKGPVFTGDTIHVEIEIIESRVTKNASRGVVKSRNEIKNQRGEVVAEYEPARLIRSNPPGVGDA